MWRTPLAIRLAFTAVDIDDAHIAEDWHPQLHDPPHRFVDEQRRGPYRLWHHTHTFVSRDGGTLCRDTVKYSVPFDFVAHRFFVRPDIESIFNFRQRKLRELFAEKPDRSGLV